jgi:hypothetical protein
MMIKILGLSKTKDDEFEITFFVNEILHINKLFVHEAQLFDNVKMPYITVGDDMEFSAFCRNNREFMRKVFELVRNPLEDVKFPVSVPLEWQDSSTLERKVA